MKVILLGAGHIGWAIAEMLIDSGDYDVMVADRDPKALFEVAALGAKTEVVSQSCTSGSTRNSRENLAVRSTAIRAQASAAATTVAGLFHPRRRISAGIISRF